MVSPGYIKWIGSILIAGLMLILGLTGGNWGTSYAADGGINTTPIIDHIQPERVPVGTPWLLLFISGSDFDINEKARVMLTTPGGDVILAEPYVTLPDAIYQYIPGDYFLEPTVYLLSVVQSDINTIPTIPIIPIHDEVSNAVQFIVYNAELVYIPIITKQ